MDASDEPTLVKCPACEGIGFEKATLRYGSGRLDRFGVWELEMCRLCDWMGLVMPVTAAYWRRARDDRNDH